MSTAVPAANRGALGLAERIIELLEEGKKQATYKYALLVALLDLCLERTSSTGLPPETLTTRQLADKVVELYWPHATPYEGRRVLRQGGGRDEQAEIVRRIATFRAEHSPEPDLPAFRARHERPKEFEQLVHFVEWKLVEMPIPRLQALGGEERRFLYTYGWTREIKQGQVTAYQKRRAGADFDNRLLLFSGVGEHLVRLNGLLRPLLHREWARKVAALNALPEARLDEFLFGAVRIPLEPVRRPLVELQEGQCFYCRAGLRDRSGGVEVDHFIPWKRYPDNGIHNLVAAHSRCNNQKRDFLAAAPHVEHWAERIRQRGDDLDSVAAGLGWAGDRERSQRVALAIYSRLPDDAQLWVRSGEFATLERSRVLGALETGAGK